MKGALHLVRARMFNVLGANVSTSSAEMFDGEVGERRKFIISQTARERRHGDERVHATIPVITV